jgi:Nif-specific regulatory protein
MQEVYYLIRKVAPRRTTVLLLGEKGSGKSLAARAIHSDGPKAAGPFLCFDSRNTPEPEEALFGQGQGQAGWGGRPRKGIIEEGEGGTVFLENIGDWPLALQARLLSYLKNISPTKSSSGPRLIAASDRDIPSLCSKGLFLEDLYYRLSVFPITIPPLRERGGDLPILARHFLSVLAQESGDKASPISCAALEALTAYDWPGNVGELKSVMRRAGILAEGKAIQPCDLPLRLKTASSHDGPFGLEERLDAIEREMLSEALKAHRGNVSKAARDLGLTRRSMGLRMKRLSLSYKDFRPNLPSSEGPPEGQGLTLESLGKRKALGQSPLEEGKKRSPSLGPALGQSLAMAVRQNSGLNNHKES